MAGHCWKCRIMPVRISENGTTTPAGIATGIVYAVDHGAKIINVSFAHRNYDSGEADAVRYAAERGAIVVASAGNTGNDVPQYPAAYPGVLSVGATDMEDALYFWSSRGPWVLLTAPGCHMVVDLWYPPGTLCGTSFTPSASLACSDSSGHAIRASAASRCCRPCSGPPGRSLGSPTGGSIPWQRSGGSACRSWAHPRQLRRTRRRDPRPASGSRARPSSRRARSSVGSARPFGSGGALRDAAADAACVRVLPLSQQGGRAHRRSARRQEPDQPVDPGHCRPVHRGSAVPRCPDSAVLARRHRDVPSRLSLGVRDLGSGLPEREERTRDAPFPSRSRSHCRRRPPRSWRRAGPRRRGGRSHAPSEPPRRGCGR